MDVAQILLFCFEVPHCQEEEAEDQYPSPMQDEEAYQEA
jgi:hypothetical protein